MKVFVLDCSVAMSWCFEDENSEGSKRVLHLLKTTTGIVPGIWPLEVSNVILTAERKNRILQTDSSIFLKLLSTLDIEIDNGLNNLINMNTISLARKHQISSYDASYLELALRFNAPLASFDKELCRAAKTEGLKLI